MVSATRTLYDKLCHNTPAGSSLPHMAFLPPSSAAKRLCVVISDIHCTDGTVGNQSGEGEDWLAFFAQVEQAAQGQDELVVILNGDIIDLIRSAAWTEAGVYPWQREHPRFAELIDTIMAGIVRQHATPQGLFGRDGFFELLRQLTRSLKASGVKVRLVPIVGNHDKELLLVDSARARFYRDCLDWAVDEDAEYRDWIAAQYGFDSTRAGAATPWLPFYYGDRGFQLFATHGQWRDNTNAVQGKGWKAGRWQPERWQQQRFAAFTDACFGDTVAAGLLSGFIWDAKNALRVLEAGNRTDSKAIARLCSILDEMDLYRPASKGIVRILQEARAQRGKGADEAIVASISTTFRANLRRWLAQAAAWRRAPFPIIVFLPLLWLLSRVRQEVVSLGVMKLMAWVQEPKPGIALRDLLGLPAFHAAYREYGFSIHTEGHTHVALEADLQFDTPEQQPNYSYVNTGAWRGQIFPKANYGYRRRGIGRALYLFDTQQGNGERTLRYYVRDALSWGSQLDKLA
ncbi:metallophosphoesterase [Chitinimonas taiwanensis]|uniref:Calcineurin-like phosphoesterase n=1 Tax=Chitinimonas taiwanensis DSM 18899 TaxID=1121279 RepID=A0A1K2HQS5_9NEIS|nr:metallophosphoesterase [Chitinimonas taiwanensis]SFZ79099.1 Calcineurin-like phosphoesterase [Chitinimonas taiwanensis DSM 18899]